MKIIYLILTLSLISCSNENKSLTKKPEIFEAKSILVSPDGIFGDVSFDEVKVLSLSLKNNSSNQETLQGPAFLSGTNASDFNIIYQSCRALIAGKSCLLKISFDARGKSFGNRGAVIQFDSVSIPISANILMPPIENKTITWSSESLDFGTLTQNSSIIKNISLTNTSKIALNETISLSPPFLVVYDNCSNKNIKPNASCLVKVKLQGSSLIEGGSVNGILSYGNPLIGQINLSADIQSEQQSQNNSNIIAYFQEIEMSQSNPLSLGSLEVGKNYIFNFSLKNIGTSNSILSNITTSSPLSIVYNNCGSILKAGTSCSIKTSLTATEASTLNLSFTSSLGIKNLPISYTIVSSERVLSLISNFSYSQPSAGPSSCKAYSPFNPSEVMAELVIQQSSFSSEEEVSIQTSVCNYLMQNSSMVSNYNVFTPNQCIISDFSLLMNIEMETGIPWFLLNNNLYFSFNENNYFIMDSWECDQNLAMNSPNFQLSGGEINLTDGAMKFPVEYNNALYYGIKGPNAAYYLLAKSNKLNSVSIISFDYKVQLDTRSPLIPFNGKLFFVAKYQEETQYKLFYLDENDVINEFAGQIPGYQYQGIRDNNALRITSTNGNYLLVNREIDRAHILKISSYNGPVVDMHNPSFNLDFLVGIQGEVIGDNYFPTAYNINNNFSYLGKVDLTTSSIEAISDLSNLESGIGNLKQKAHYTLAKTNQGTKLWFIIIDPLGNKIVEYNSVNNSNTTHNIQGFGINSRTFGPSVSYFSTSSGATYYVYKISDDGLQLVDIRFGTDVSVGFISNDGSLVYVEDNGNDIYKINYNQPKTKLFDNKIFYQEQYAYVNQNLRDFHSNPKFDNQIVVAMAETNPITENIESNFKITFIDLDTLQITKQISICPSDIGGYDFRPEPSALHVGSNALFLSVRTCGTSDYQLYQYK